MNFWNNLPSPFFALAPMADVTDAAFRRLFAKYSKTETSLPLVLWTEFVSCDGLYHTREIQRLPDVQNPLMGDLLFDSGEHPIVAQLFTSKPEMMEYGARLCLELGFDGVDINMGCPDKTIEKQGCGSAMIKNPSLALEIIAAARTGAQSDQEKGIPVSVKTRIGYNQNEIATWIPWLLESNIAALTIHARTRKEMSNVPARWEHVKEVVSIRDQIWTSDVQISDIQEKPKILGNGDVQSLADGREKAEATGCDGIMVGRGAFGNPWFFNQKISRQGLAIDEVLNVLVEHCQLFEEKLPHKSFHIMKKHFKAYVNGWDGAKELRNQLMNCENATAVAETIRSKNYQDQQD